MGVTQDKPPSQQTEVEQTDQATALVGSTDLSESGEPEPLFELHQRISQLLRREATTSDREAWEQSVLALIRAYGQITRDERLVTSQVLEGYRVRLRARLLKVQTRLKRELKRRGVDVASRLASLSGESLSTIGHRQRDGAAAGQARAGARHGLEQQGSASLAAAAGTEKGAAGGAATDYGLLLVELIQRTISPDFWDVNGGPGTIVYYRQWHALVIRATPDIHRQIGGLVGGVR